MATAPVKSQQLHYFSLSHLKWGHKGHTNTNHRFRRRESPPSTVNNHLTTPRYDDLDGCSDSEKLPLPSEKDTNALSSSPCSSQKQHEPKQKQLENEEEEKVGREEGEGKPWNLRPRRGETVSLRKLEMTAEHKPHMPRLQGLRGNNVDGHGVRSDKRKLWISLSREEIEEDVYALTGSRPARRPKKRSKTIQKQLDCVFPGLYLVGLAVDSYRVYDTMK